MELDDASRHAERCASSGHGKMWRLLVLLVLARAWEDTCFGNMGHMAHCCDQPERCFGAGKEIQKPVEDAPNMLQLNSKINSKINI